MRGAKIIWFWNKTFDVNSSQAEGYDCVTSWDHGQYVSHYLTSDESGIYDSRVCEDWNIDYCYQCTGAGENQWKSWTSGYYLELFIDDSFE